jgi:putative transposase
MARKSIPEVPGGIWHVTVRAVHAGTHDPRAVDREWHLAHLGVVSIRFGWIVLAYVQLTTHSHYVFRTPEPTRAEGMKLFSAGHAQRINIRDSRKGHLHGRRYHPRLVESHSHLLELFRYLDLNPCRAGLCREPLDWRWGSHRAIVGDAPAPHFLAVDEVLRLYHPNPDRARRLYRAAVMDGLDSRPS